MGDMEVPGTGDSVVWAELMQRLGASVHELADGFVERVNAIPSYASGAITAAELHDVAVESLGLVVAALADPAGFPKVEQYARELGERRAAQGVPAEALTSAVRLNFPVIWSKLTELAGPELMATLATRVEEVWVVLDNYAIACYSSYVSARMREARSEVSVRQEFIAALFATEATTPEAQTRFASVFEAPIASPYAVVAINGRPSAAMRKVAREPLRFLHETGSNSYLFWPLAAAELAAEPQLPRGLDALPCGLAVAEHLGGIAAAAARAEFLADHLTAADAGPLTFDAAWPRLSRVHLARGGFQMTAELDAMLAEARNDDERERVRETVEVFLRTGSIAETSSSLFTHRNTVLNRLRRFAELTGIDLRVPAEAAKVVVAWLG